MSAFSCCALYIGQIIKISWKNNECISKDVSPSPLLSSSPLVHTISIVLTAQTVDPGPLHGEPPAIAPTMHSNTTSPDYGYGVNPKSTAFYLGHFRYTPDLVWNIFGPLPHECTNQYWFVFVHWSLWASASLASNRSPCIDERTLREHARDNRSHPDGDSSSSTTVADRRDCECLCPRLATILWLAWRRFSPQSGRDDCKESNSPWRTGWKGHRMVAGKIEQDGPQRILIDWVFGVPDKNNLYKV